MQKIEFINGRVLFVSSKRIVLARGSHLFESIDGGNSWEHLTCLPVNFFNRFLLRSRLMRRLFRIGFHHLISDQFGTAVIANKSTYMLDENELIFLDHLHGSRPLALCQFEGFRYYGEYRSNAERSMVNIWEWKKGFCNWLPASNFDNIRHIHGVYHDPYENTLWVTTGDKDDESAIWRSEDQFLSIKKVVGGSQQFRAVQLLFTKDHVYFGTDTPEEKNFLYRMDREGINIEQLCEVESSVFFGCKVGKSLFFSTAVEPSLINHTRVAHVIGSSDGDDWKIVKSFRKDFLSLKYFQYGQVLFPSGEGDSMNLWLTPMSTNYDQTTLKIPLENIF